MYLRYFLPVYLFIYVLAAIVWRTYLVWKHTGINPVTFKGSDNAHDFVGRVFKLVFVLVVLVVFVYSFFPFAYGYTGPIQLTTTARDFLARRFGFKETTREPFGEQLALSERYLTSGGGAAATL